MSLFFHRLKVKSLSRFSLFSFFFVVLGGFVLLVTAYFFPVNGVAGEGLPRFLGRFHPLVLHFPVALLPLALAIELLRFAPEPWRRWCSGSLPILTLAALFAIATAILGILLAANEGHAGTLIERHRTFGIAVALMTIVALGLRVMMDVFPRRRFFTPVLLGLLSTTCVVMVLAAHDGGNMVHGQNYLAQYAPSPLKSVLEGKHAETTTDYGTLAPQDAALQATYNNDIAPLLERHCSSCHGPSRQNGSVRFDTLSPLMSNDHDVEAWSSVRDALNAHQMPPPEEARQPTTEERQEMVAWIDASFKKVAAERQANRPSHMRRLTAKEYETTLQELFGTAFKFGESLPSAPISEHGYSRDTTLLSVSALELEYFFSIARESVENYVVFGRRLPQTEHYLVEFEDVVYRPGAGGSYSTGEPLDEEALSEKKQLRASTPAVYAERTLFPLPDGELDLSTEDLNRLDRQKLNGKYARIKSKQRHKSGELIARVHVAAKLGDDGSAPRLQFTAGGRVGPEIALAGACDVTAPPENPQVCTFRMPLRDTGVAFGEEGAALTLSAFNMSRDPDAFFEVDPEAYNFGPNQPGPMARQRMRITDSNASKAAMRASGVNELYLDAVEVDIVPFGVETTKKIWRIDTMRALSNAGSDSRAVAEDSIRRFMERAYRRTVSVAELDSMISLYDQFRLDGDTFEEALKETFSSVLVSDRFLFIAPPIVLDDPLTISDEERTQLAARLSYFLWGGPPDDRLLDLAAKNRLGDPATLAIETKRMLADPRARRFSRQFAQEWLRLDKFDLVAVNPEFYPHYDVHLGEDMVEETIGTFQAIFHEHGDARELISSNKVYINQRLARHYGFPSVTGGEMQPVTVPDYRTRGGLLHQAAVLTMTADGAESNPIYRGVWILERLLNDPPPPPPPAVPPLDASNDDLGPLTLKQQIELHAEQSACAACHAKIDPWGLPLESFDAIGAWREDALVVNPNTAVRSLLPVDSSTVLATGEEISGSEDLVEYLHTEREDEFAASLTWHMMTYALGRAPNLGDADDLASIHRHFRTSGYRLSELALAIVQSDAFLVMPDRPALPETESLQATADTDNPLH